MVNMASLRSLGGRSRDLLGVGFGPEGRARAVQGLGLPGSASHMKGTAAWVSKGGVMAPLDGWSGDLRLGSEYNSCSLGVALFSPPTSSPILSVVSLSRKITDE